jgi:SulP family sulfate permease
MFEPKDWLPKSVLALRHYSKRQFLSDSIAGVTVGLVALLLAMAFAIASGMSSQSGIYCAVVAGFLISALGGSSTQFGGPTGAFVVVVFGIVARYGVDGLYMCTLLAGVILVVLGVTGLGTAVKFIPRSVVVGFTNGIAVIIASTQIKDFFGLKVDKVPGEFWQDWKHSQAISAPYHLRKPASLAWRCSSSLSSPGISNASPDTSSPFLSAPR